MKIINKIAFIVHEPTMFAHYASVWSALPKDDFVIVLLNAFNRNSTSYTHGVIECMKKIQILGYEYTYLVDILQNKIKYKYVVSNHFIDGTSPYPATVKDKLKYTIKRAINLTRTLIGLPEKYSLYMGISAQYIPLKAGIKQIRFMYGADIGDGWSLQPWNEIYDLFLCHGPNDQEQIEKRFHGKTALMGYPRYDEYFNRGMDVSDVAEEFKLDPAKKTILWMSTTGLGANSIPAFAEPIAGLMDSYNVIARPHPIAFRSEPENIELLRSLNFWIDDNAVRDMNRLYKAVDFVLCDFGGSAFGAIYLGKKLIMLDVPGTENCDWVSNASNFELRDAVPMVGVNDFRNIYELLANENSWNEWECKRMEVSNKYFADYRGTSSRRAAEILGNLDSILSD